ncbi:MAG: M48 family metallopeptidase [Pseudomonadales bacterium]|nr:M48 family metallopeptidase [Pseudomonadales bacterium]
MNTGIDLDFEYQIVRSKRKTVAIHLRNGKVEVRTPQRIDNAWVQQFVENKADWINTQLAQQLKNKTEQYQMTDGESITFLGHELQLQLRLASRNKVYIEAGKLCIEGRIETSEKALKLFHNWLKDQARAYMVPRTEAYAARLGVEDSLQQIRFRKTRSKWGHCSSKGIIQFNELIMLAPTMVVEYLIIHEVCHLVYMNHSRQYWKLVEGHCPDYSEMKTWLTENGHRFWFDTEQQSASHLDAGLSD